MAKARTAAVRAVAIFAVLNGKLSSGHGVLNLPASTRSQGSLEKAGTCELGECLYFSHEVQIPGEPTINSEELRTFNVKVSSGDKDWSRKNPWRAPGTAPVFGSGCGVAGGAPTADQDAAAYSPPGLAQGEDMAKDKFAMEPVVWRKGSVVEVAWGITANHGGGYSYRLCPKSGNVSEECFQQHVLRFAADKHWLQYGNVTQADGSILALPRFELPMVRASQGTHPQKSEWARNPIPSCLICDQNSCKGLSGQEFFVCAQMCSGDDLNQCPPGMTQFTEPMYGLSGFTPSTKMNIKKVLGWAGFSFSIVDQVHVPDDLPEGEYLLSWRWDCEQSAQVWQNCADVKLVDGTDATEESGEYGSQGSASSSASLFP
eukprot:gb/GFBE01067561.1/.p1 GENE.gb/GFBE01067561.1/~~gb/GFBE01067561.1/.p1  ORF type:complete len:373 (+),score=94.86 gb/GFBE01067561.1/:1-1119(+)